MKYMTFTASCPYAAIANVLERMNINTEDYLIIRESQIPYLFAYDEKYGVYCCGSQLAGKFYFDLYLNQIGLTVKEVFLDKEEVCSHLRNNPLSILGLNTEESRHSFVFIKYENVKYTLLNPRYEFDNKPDYLEYTEAELVRMLNDKTGISSIVKGTIITPDTTSLIIKSISDIKRYREDLYVFLNRRLTPEEIFKKRDEILRPFGLDLLPMMKIIEHKKLIDLLIEIKKECLNMILSKEIKKGFDHINKVTLDLFFNEYIKLLSSKLVYN